MLDRPLNKRRLYITLQALGWGTFFIVYTSIAVSFADFHWEIYASYITTIGVGIALTELYRNWIKKNNAILFRMALKLKKIQINY